MDMSRKTVALCAEGTQAEFQGRLDDARRLFAQAWDEAADDFDRAVAAHYVAHLAEEPAEKLKWDLLALHHAACADPSEVEPLMGSLNVNVGHAYELTGECELAAEYYARAAEYGVVHQPMDS